MSVVASRYAEAFFSLSLERKSVDEYKKDLLLVKESFLCVDKLKEFFISENISIKDKKDILTSSLKGKINKDTLNFLKLLIDKRRINHFEEIINEYISLANEKLNIKEGIIESCRPLDSKLINDLEKTLSKDGVKVELHQKINPSLISGFKVVFKDQIIDASMKEKINRLHDLISRKGGTKWN